jgi:hypothetical protein
MTIYPLKDLIRDGATAQAEKKKTPSWGGTILEAAHLTRNCCAFLLNENNLYRCKRNCFQNFDINDGFRHIIWILALLIVSRF